LVTGVMRAAADASGELEVPFVEFGPIGAHALSMEAAIDLVARRAASGRGGFVLTPNLDHLALSLKHPEMRAAYGRAFLSLADGMPLVTTSRLLGLPVREKVSGSDLFVPLMARCARDGLPVYLLGATTATCETAVRRLREEEPRLIVAGHDSSHFDLDARPEEARAALRRAAASGARLILVFLPPLKQLLLYRFEADYRPALGIGAGGTLAFYAGEVRRAPAWASRAGLEWLFRLASEPGRLWRRYLLEDPRALPVLMGMAWKRARGRSLHRPSRLTVSPAET
jgi:N-acetylglucosaminyldiphosphoundecaprenol N-acetyl-beta-D-mannosaminyltransferase